MTEHNNTSVNWNQHAEPGDRVWELGAYCAEHANKIARVTCTIQGVRVKLVPVNHTFSRDLVTSEFDRQRGFFIPQVQPWKVMTCMSCDDTALVWVASITPRKLLKECDHAGHMQGCAHIA